MSYTKFYAIATAASIFLAACKSEFDKSPVASTIDTELETMLLEKSGGKGKSFFVLPESDDFASIPQDPKNPLSSAKVELGKLLYHETGIGQNPIKLSSMNTYSCASCHHAQAGFQACVAQGIGDGGIGYGVQGEKRTQNLSYKASEIDVQPIRTPSILNVAFQELMLWNGQFGATGDNIGTESKWKTGNHPTSKNFLGFEGVETQAIAGRDVHRLVIDQMFMENVGNYKELYISAFDQSSFSNKSKLSNNGALAIAAYERTVLANQSPFQLWLRGNYTAMDETEKKGALLFFGKAGCASCHNGPSLADMEFYALGMKDLKNGNYGTSSVANVNDADPTHKGRGGFTGKSEDLYKFKVPQLYNLKDSPFYGHGSSFYSIREVVEYKNKGVKENASTPNAALSSEFVPLNLTEEEVDQISLFLEKSLRDPNLMRYVPKKLPSGLAFPNADNQSKIDLGF